MLSFSLGLFWPRLMGRWGSVIGLPFALEAFAFFIEAIFLGIYLYGWDRLSPWTHWWSGVPVAVSGAASAWFVVTANAWMHTPVGYVLQGDRLVEVDPIGAMLNPSTPVMTTHMLLAAYMATGLVGGVHLRVLVAPRPARHVSMAGLAVGLVLGLVLAPIQVVVGDLAARHVAEYQPVKLAALEGQWRDAGEGAAAHRRHPDPEPRGDRVRDRDPRADSPGSRTGIRTRSSKGWRRFRPPIVRTPSSCTSRSR